MINPKDYQSWVTKAVESAKNADFVALDSSFEPSQTIVTNVVPISIVECESDFTVIEGKTKLTASIEDGNNIFEAQQFFEEVPARFSKLYNNCDQIWKDNADICICPLIDQLFTAENSALEI